MHEDIKKFNLDGEVAYPYLSKVRKTLEDALEDKMRMVGYVPVLDIDPQLSQEYFSEAQKFRVTISLYGAYVGDSECEIAGLMFGKQVKRSIPRPRLNQSLTN